MDGIVEAVSHAKVRYARSRIIVDGEGLMEDEGGADSYHSGFARIQHHLQRVR